MTIQRHFDHYLPVVHLWAAYYINRRSGDDTQTMFFDPANLQHFLSLAAGVRYFAEMTTQARTKTPLVEPGVMYEIPRSYVSPRGKVDIWFGDDVRDTLREHLKGYANRLLP